LTAAWTLVYSPPLLATVSVTAAAAEAGPAAGSTAAMASALRNVAKRIIAA